MSGFAMTVKIWTQHAAEGLRQVRQDALVDICSSIIAETPKKTGLARGNWQFSLESPKTEAIPLRPSMSALAELLTVLASMKGDETFIARNNLSYATRLEFGWSQQAPAGMVRKNVMRWQNAVEAAALKARFST